MSARGLASYDHDGRASRIAGAQTEITARKAHEQELSYAAFHDEMTGLPNRTLFMDRLQQVVNRCQHLGEKPAAVMFIDLDRFKFINDTLGHATGDLLLKEVATLLLEAVRPGDTVSRIGGDEFTVLLQEVDGKEDAIQLVERVRDTINKYYDLDGRNVEVTASVGVYLFNGTECMADQVLRNADLAMYHSKNEKRSHYELFGTFQHKKMLDDLQIELDLREALNDGKFKEFKEMGVGLSIDDFGTGYSSLSYLHNLPFDTLKIDQSFVSRIGIDKKAEHLIATIIGLAEDIELTTIAEGVETLQQFGILRCMNCDYAQGFYFGSPMPADEATKVLLSHNTIDVEADSNDFKAFPKYNPYSLSS